MRLRLDIPLLRVANARFSSPQIKRPLSVHISFSRKKSDHESRRNARVKETYRNSLRGIGLITREPVGFLLDLGRFHQRSHHFLSLFSLSKYGEFPSSAFLSCVFGAERKGTIDERKKGRRGEKNLGKSQKSRTSEQAKILYTFLHRI